MGLRDSTATVVALPGNYGEAESGQTVNPHISWLDAQGRKVGVGPLSHRWGVSTLSQLLRTLGEHVDRTEASGFKISWVR